MNFNTKQDPLLQQSLENKTKNKLLKQDAYELYFKQYTRYNVTQNCDLPSQWFWHTVWKHHHTMSHTTATLVVMILLPLGGSYCLADPVIA